MARQYFSGISRYNVCLYNKDLSPDELSDVQFCIQCIYTYTQNIQKQVHMIRKPYKHWSQANLCTVNIRVS